MRYHYKKPDSYISQYGITYQCRHPVYNRCTLYLVGDKGLAVIQQRNKGKFTYWSSIDPWIVDDIYTNSNFIELFNEKAGECVDGLYPTVTIRQVMWRLRMKPLKKERWETVFDRGYI